MAGMLFYEPQAKILNAAGRTLPLLYAVFYKTGTTALAPVYADAMLFAPLPQTPVGRAGVSTQVGVQADDKGRFPPIYLDPAIIYRVQMVSVNPITFAATVLQDIDPYVPRGVGSVVTNSFRLIGAGVTGAPSVVASYTMINNAIVVLSVPALGTSLVGASPTFDMLGLPREIIPRSGAFAGNRIDASDFGRSTACFPVVRGGSNAIELWKNLLPGGDVGWVIGNGSSRGVDQFTFIYPLDGISEIPATTSVNVFGPQNQIINVAGYGTQAGTGIIFAVFGGTLIVNGSASPVSWYAPQTPNIGLSYFIKITRTSGPAFASRYSAVPGPNPEAGWVVLDNGVDGVEIGSSSAGTSVGTYQLSSSNTGVPVVAQGSISCTFG